MHYARRTLLFLLAALALSRSLAAADYLFVFHGDAAASVYDAETLQLVASPALGPGAVHAIGVPDPSQRDRLLKIYVVRSKSVLVLDPQPPFAIRATLPLLADITLGERSAVLLPGGAKLLVISGAFVHLFDALDPTNPLAGVQDIDDPVADFAVLSNSQFAYLARPGISRLDILSLTVSPPQLLAGPVVLPAAPATVAAAPNGAGIYAAAPDEIFEVDPRTNAIAATIESPPGSPSGAGFNPAAPLETGFVRLGSTLSLFDLPTRKSTRTFAAGGAIQEVISPSLDRIYVRAGAPAKFLRAVPSSGLLSEVVNPMTADPFVLPAVDMEVDEASRFLFLAFGSLGSVVKLSADAASLLGEIDPPSPPTGIAVVSTLGLPPASLEVYGGNHQFGAVGSRLAKPLAVRARSADGRPVTGESISFSSNHPSARFFPATVTTNREGVAQTALEVPITTPLEATARVGAGTPSAVFDINVGAEGRNGIQKVSGDYQITSSNQAFPTPFEVQVLDEADPTPGVQLTVNPLNVNITCSVPLPTDETGTTTFTCSAPFTVTGQRTEQIQVSDPAGRVLGDPFHVTIVPDESDLPVNLRLFSDRVFSGVGGETLVNGLRFDAITSQGEPVENVGVQFFSASDVSVTPPLAVTVPDGITMANVTLGCTLGSGTISLELNAANVTPEVVTFTTLVGPPARAAKIRGDGQFGQEGEAIDELRIVVRDACGNRVHRAPVAWEVSPPGAAIIDRAARSTNIDGEAFALLRLGDQPGAFQVIARSSSASAIFNLSVNATAAQIVIASGDGQSLLVGEAAPLPLVVELRNEAGMPLAGGSVVFEVTGGSATLNPLTAQSGQAGRAATNITSAGAVGPLTIVARSSGLEVIFRLTVAGRVPAVPANGFVNAASFAAGFVPGSAGSIFGTGLMEGITGVVNANVFPFPTMLRGIRVLVNGVPAPIIALANVNGVEQINIQVPFETPAGTTVTVTIENNGTSQSFSGIQTFRAQPGIFEIVQGTTRSVAALHLDSTLVSSTNPALPGETISLFLTGMGPTVPPVGTNQAGPVPAALTVEQPVVIIDGVNNAQVLGSAYAPQLVTAYQINLVIPPNAQAGNRAIRVQVRGILSQQAIIPIAPALPTP